MSDQEEGELKKEEGEEVTKEEIDAPEAEDGAEDANGDEAAEEDADENGSVEAVNGEEDKATEEGEEEKCEEIVLKEKTSDPSTRPQNSVVQPLLTGLSQIETGPSRQKTHI